MGVFGGEDMFKNCLDSSVCQYIKATIKSKTLQLAATSGYFASSPFLPIAQPDSTAGAKLSLFYYAVMMLV